MAPHVILFTKSARTPSCSTTWESWTAAKATRRPGFRRTKRRIVRLIWQMIPKHTLLKSHLVDHKVVRAITLDSRRLVGLEITLHFAWECFVITCDFVMILRAQPPTQVICGSPWGKFSTPGDCELCKRRHMAFFNIRRANTWSRLWKIPNCTVEPRYWSQRKGLSMYPRGAPFVLDLHVPLRHFFEN